MVRNFNKLAKDLYNQDSPEAMAYLRIMGNELGYIKSTNELSAIVDRMATYIQALKYLPAWVCIYNILHFTYISYVCISSYIGQHIGFVKICFVIL